MSLVGCLNAPVDRLLTSDLEVWSGRIADLYGGLQVFVSNKARFLGQLDIRRVAGTNFTVVKSSASRVWHDGSLSSAQAHERYLVKAQISGAASLSTSRGVVQLRPGEMVICDNARPYTLEFSEDIELISVPIEPSLLMRFYAQPGEVVFQKPDPDLAVTRLAFRYLRSLCEISGAHSIEQDAELLRDTFFELLLRGYRGSVAAAVLSTVHAGHLRRCKEYIAENIPDENLNPDQIASALSISKRYLHSIFAASGEHLTVYIFAQRLELAAQMLRSRQQRQLTIAEVAYSCGFKSQAHFARAFKARFGQTASAYRQL